jgi:phospholipid transport system substrate-binding protein
MYRFIASIFFVFGWFALSFGTPAYFSALQLPWSVLNTAHAASEPGTARVRAVNEAVTALLRRNPEPGSPEERKLTAEISKTVGAFLDVETLGKSALSDHWGKLSRAQRTEFSRLIGSLVEASYVRALRTNLDYAVKYQSETERGAERLVATEVSAVRDGRTRVISIDYVLRETARGWRAVDVITDGVGMVENYRAQFNKIIAQEGFDGLIGRMRKKLSSS